MLRSLHATMPAVLWHMLAMMSTVVPSMRAFMMITMVRCMRAFVMITMVRTFMMIGKRSAGVLAVAVKGGA